jgi:dimethylargininase
MIHGLTSAHLGKPDFGRALAQHAAYVEVLRDCGLQVTVLETDNDYPDSTFIEDTALLVPGCAVITRPGAPSRRGETASVKEALKSFFDTIEYISTPGTVDAGDIMMVGSHFYIGLSRRTNREGAAQMAAILEKHGLTASTVPLRDFLHLKSGVACLENNTLVAAGEFVAHPVFQDYHILAVGEDERYAANCLWINDRVLVAEGFPETRSIIEAAGFETIAVDVSEFRKIDGGLSCLSLRF